MRELLSIGRFYLGSRDVWQAFGCLILTVAALVAFALVTTRAAGQDSPQQDRERKAKAALALAGAGDPAKCVCTKGNLMAWEDAVVLSRGERRPVVVFAGDVEPRCCADAIPVRMTLEKAKLLRPEKPIVVYIPTPNGSMIQVTDMPANVSDAEIKAAVKLAKQQLDRK